MTKQTIKHINMAGNVTAENFDMAKVDEAVKQLKLAYRLLAGFDDEQKKAKERNDELQSLMQKAMDDCDLEQLTKLTTERKRLLAKLAETAAPKIQRFDETVNTLVALGTLENALDKSKDTQQPELKKAA